MCELLVGLGEVSVLDVTGIGDRLRVTIEPRAERPTCPGCGGPVAVKDRDRVELADLRCFGRPAVLVGRKIRWGCPAGCGSFTEQDLVIASSRLRLHAISCHTSVISPMALVPARTSMSMSSGRRLPHIITLVMLCSQAHE